MNKKECTGKGRYVRPMMEVIAVEVGNLMEISLWNSGQSAGGSGPSLFSVSEQEEGYKPKQYDAYGGDEE